MRARLKPPPGVTAELGGLPVLVAGANARALVPLAPAAGRCSPACSRSRSCCWRVYRRCDRALVPLVPIALATGWSALVLFAIRIPLNPMSATLGALVIAISTEFSVLLTARFRAGARRRAGAGRRAARHLRLDRRGRARLGRDGDRRLRGAGVLRRRDAARLRHRDRRRPDRLAAGRAGRAAVGARARRAPGGAARTPRRRPRPSRRERPGHGPFGVRERGEEPPARAAAEAAGAAAAARGARPSRWIVGVAVVHRDRLHHAQHDPHGRAGLARPGPRRPAAAVRRPAGALEPRRRREPRHQARRGRAGRPPGLRGPRAGRPQRLPARREAGRSRSRSSPRARRPATARSTRSSACAADYPDISFAAVGIRGDRDELRAHDPQARLDAAGRLGSRRRRRQRLRAWRSARP